MYVCVCVCVCVKKVENKNKQNLAEDFAHARIVARLRRDAAGKRVNGFAYCVLCRMCSLIECVLYRVALPTDSP